MIKQAVILAAGKGSRLKERTKSLPKGLLSIDSKAIIQWSVEKLLKAGIQDILIGTGYLSEAYERFFQRTPHIRCVKSERFGETGSMYTLYNMRNFITHDFLLLESDLLYEQYALTVLQEEDDQKDVILSSSQSESGDEVFIETDSNGCLMNMSKNASDLKEVFSELVGITRISLSTYQKLCHVMEISISTHPTLEYEEVLVKISRQVKILVRKIPNLAWCEIDDEGHFRRAINLVFPEIKKKEEVR